MKLDNLLAEFQYCQKALTAIGDETRQHIICVMLKESGEKGMRVTDITEHTNLSRPAVSHHMQIMKDSGIVKYYKEKTFIYYYLDPDAQMVNTMASLMEHITELTQSIARCKE
ncbi:ArsR/SmtB family transcription factor [Anaerosporobacter sp.]